MNRFGMDGQRVLVTGGGSGIGAGIARRVLEAGAECVTIVGRRQEVLAATAATLGAEFGRERVRSTTCDITVSADVEAAMDLAGDGGHVHTVVANAGGTGSGGLAPFLYLDEAAWTDVCQLNLVGTANTMRTAAWNMRAHGGGTIVAISTAAAVGPEICAAHYSATKAGVDMLVRNAAQELGHFGIRVNSLQPGVTVTESSRRFYHEGVPVFDDLMRRTPLGRAAEPEEMGDTVVYLASPAGSYVTGQVFAVDGGLSVPPMADLQAMARARLGDAPVDDALKPRLA